MPVKEYREYRTSKSRKKRVSRKKHKRRHNLKKAVHNLFYFLMVIFIFPAAYFLIWGLLIEPNLPRHIYGPGDFKEFIYLLASLFIIAISYVMILLVKYKPLEFKWVDDFKLLASVNFSLDKFTAMKQMGIKYQRQKKKKVYRYNHQDHTEHKSITE